MSGVHPLSPMRHQQPAPGNGPGGVNALSPEMQGDMVQVSGSGPGGCLACVGLQSGLISRAELERIKSERFAEVMAHEQAHASAAGAFGGGIHIEYDANGIAIGGHVPIHIPGLDPQNPEESLKNLGIIKAAALAPGADASSQDHSVAAMATSMMGQAQVMLQNKERIEQGLFNPQRALPGGLPNGAPNKTTNHGPSGLNPEGSGRTPRPVGV